jgi:hypothetical protein
VVIPYQHEAARFARAGSFQFLCPSFNCAFLGLADGIEHRFELEVVFLFQRGQLAG